MAYIYCNNKIISLKNCVSISGDIIAEEKGGTFYAPLDYLEIHFILRLKHEEGSIEEVELLHKDLNEEKIKEIIKAIARQLEANNEIIYVDEIIDEVLK